MAHLATPSDVHNLQETNLDPLFVSSDLMEIDELITEQAPISNIDQVLQEPITNDLGAVTSEEVVREDSPLSGNIKAKKISSKSIEETLDLVTNANINHIIHDRDKFHPVPVPPDYTPPNEAKHRERVVRLRSVEVLQVIRTELNTRISNREFGVQEAIVDRTLVLAPNKKHMKSLRYFQPGSLRNVRGGLILKAFFDELAFLQNMLPDTDVAPSDEDLKYVTNVFRKAHGTLTKVADIVDDAARVKRHFELLLEVWQSSHAGDRERTTSPELTVGIKIFLDSASWQEICDCARGWK